MLNGVEFSANGFLPQRLTGHDECPTNISVFDEPLPVGEVQRLGHLQGGDAA